MAELNITLEALRTCEAEVEELERLTSQLPKDIEAALERAAAARVAIEAEEQKLEAAEQSRRTHEAEMQDCEAKREKYKGQTALVKTNEEYTALLREIDQATEGIGRIEEEILVAMEQIEEISGGLADTEREQERIAAEFDGQAKELQNELRQVESDLESRDKELGERTGELEAPVRHLFERARKAKGSGTTIVSGRVCTACHRDVPFEDINRVLGGEVVPCQSCRRLIVIDLDS